MHIHIVGGGIIGLCSAWYLKKAGCEVTIIDRSDLSDGTSHGNAGMIVPSHFVPLAAPGVIAQGIKWMFQEKSPFYIRPRLNLELGQWLWHFYRSCSKEKVQAAMPILFQFNEWSKELYKAFSEEEGFDFSYEEKGLLMLYKTAKAEEEEGELAEQAHKLGIEAEIISQSGLQELEPGIRIDARGGILFPGDAHLYPNQFIARLIAALKKEGVKFKTGQTVSDFNYSNDKITQIRLDSGEDLEVDQLLLCSGSWTARILKKLGQKMLLQDGRGYSFTLKDPALRPGIPTILTEAKVAVTPMGKDLRIGGSLELSNLSTKINPKRLAGIYESMPRYYPDLSFESPDLGEVWQGYRPCTPDGMPYIDKSNQIENLAIATGHGMMGMSLGPATGKLLSEIMTRQKPSIETRLFSLNRF
ncbi:MAG: FAD-dependent oxidoreductase [Bacteroidia bacterium]|nr:FAD-dependent oxidoreductase [Bacteroidia bacterium]